MSSYLPLLLITPLMAAIAIAFGCSHSLLSVVMVLVGAIAGAIVIGLSGISWLQILHRTWMASQAAGLIFVPIILPICAYSGAVSGSSLVASLYCYGSKEASSLAFQLIAIGLTIGLSGLIPSAIAAVSFGSTARNGIQPALPIFGIGAGVVSSWVATQLAALLINQLPLLYFS